MVYLVRDQQGRQRTKRIFLNRVLFRVRLKEFHSLDFLRPVVLIHIFLIGLYTVILQLFFHSLVVTCCFCCWFLQLRIMLFILIVLFLSLLVVLLWHVSRMTAFDRVTNSLIRSCYAYLSHLVVLNHMLVLQILYYTRYMLRKMRIHVVLVWLILMDPICSSVLIVVPPSLNQNRLFCCLLVGLVIRLVLILINSWLNLIRK